MRVGLRSDNGCYDSARDRAYCEVNTNLVTTGHARLGYDTGDPATTSIGCRRLHKQGKIYLRGDTI